MTQFPRAIFRRVPVFLSLAAVFAATLGGPLIVVCRAPGGHFGMKVLILSSIAGQDACCDCLTWQLPDRSDEEGSAASIWSDDCQQPCNDTSLTQPFTHAIFRVDQIQPLETPPIDAFAISGLPLDRVPPGARSLGAPPILEFLRTSVLLI